MYQGDWKPSVNLPTLLSMIRLLLAHPNPDDGLVADVTEQFVSDRASFDAKARAWTRRHAQSDGEEPACKRQRVQTGNHESVLAENAPVPNESTGGAAGSPVAPKSGRSEGRNPAAADSGVSSESSDDDDE